MSSNPHKLFAKYFEGTITPEESGELESLLENDNALQGEFLEYMNVCVALEDNAAYQDNACSPRREQKTPDNSPFARFVSATAYAIAAAACIAFAFLLFGPSQQSSDGIVTARVLRNDDAVTKTSLENLAIGNQVALNELELTNGWLRLELPKGVIFDIYGPAKGRFVTAEKFQLDSGRLNVDVGLHGKGFTVITDNADIVDLGTRFGVELNDQDMAKVAVFSGEVEVHSKEHAKNPLLLAEGEGLQVGSSGLSSRLMSINIPDERAPQVNPSTHKINFDIRDNLTSEQSLRYYGIVPNGMREGANVYTTQKRVRWKANESEAFPSELVGSDLIQTFHNDRLEGDLEVELNLNQPSTVFVMFDERYVVPEWLVESFIDTKMTVRSGPWRPVGLVHDIIPNSEGEFYIHYKIWKKNVSNAQTLFLGESTIPKTISPQRAMYGIAIKPTESAEYEIASSSTTKPHL